MLPDCDPAQAAATAQKMVEAVRAAAKAFPGEIKPSLSIGVATAKGDDDYESLWLRADTALYVAKRSGRNRIAQEEVAQEEVEQEDVVEIA
jgi:diguanylate cyclase (GGDEF)-like protein